MNKLEIQYIHLNSKLLPLMEKNQDKIEWSSLFPFNEADPEAVDGDVYFEKFQRGCHKI
jgi:hypothetical protein